MQFKWRGVLSLILGVAFYALAMPPIGWWWSAPIGLLLIFECKLRSFWPYFIAGTLVHLCLYAWVIPVSMPGWIALAIVTAALWSLPFFLYTRWPDRMGIAALWVTLEGLRAFLGWGWLPLAASAIESPTLLAWARLGGETLLGFILVYAVLFVNSGSRVGTRVLRAVIVILFLIVGGLILEEQPSHSTTRIKAGFVQPNAPTKETYSDEDNAQELSSLHRLSMQLHEKHPEIIFWPEESLSWAPVNTNEFLKSWTEAGAAGLKTPIVTGALWREEERYYNAVALLDPTTGLYPQPYKKQRLVPFGEYIPFAQFSWMRSLTPIVDSFAAGEKSIILTASTKAGTVRIWPLVCYEDTFDFLSDHAGNKSDLMAVFINDGWFYPQAQSQHAAHSILRTVEQGIPLLRVSNSGLSGVITPDGRADYIYSNKELGATLEVPLEHIDTPYSHWGNCWRWGAAILLIWSLLAKKPKT